MVMPVDVSRIDRRKRTRDLLDRLFSDVLLREPDDNAALDRVRSMAAEAPDLFLDEMRKRNATPDDVKEMALAFDADEQDADEIASWYRSPSYVFNYGTNQFARSTPEGVAERERYYEQFPTVAPPGTPGKITPEQYDAQISTVFSSVFPDLDMGQVIETATEDFDSFLEAVRGKGRNQDTETLLKLIGYDDNDIAVIFPPEAPQGMPVNLTDFLAGASDREGLPPISGRYQPPVSQVSGKVTAPQPLKKPKVQSMDEFTGQYFAERGWPTEINRATADPGEVRTFDQRQIEVADAYIAERGIAAFLLSGLGRLAGVLPGGRAVKAAVSPGAEFTPEDFNWTLVDAALFGVPAARIGIQLAKTGAEKAFVVALNQGLDKWIATQGRLVGETANAQSLLGRLVVGDRTWLTQRATANFQARMAERRGAEVAAKMAAEDTVKDAERYLLPKLTETNTGVPGQTKSLAEIQTAGKMELTPKVPDVPPGKVPAPVPKPPTTTPEPSSAPVSPELPKAEPGMPEPGVQASMLPEVTAKEVRPVGKGKITQISLDDQLKLAKVMVTEGKKGIEREIYEKGTEAQVLKEYIQNDPADKLVKLLKTSGTQKGDLPNLTVKQFKDLTGNDPLPNSLTTDKKHVRWEYSLDQLASERGFESGEKLREAIYKAAENRAKLKALQDDVKKLQGEAPPLPPLPEPTAVEVAESRSITGQPILTPAQIDITLELFGKYIEGESALDAWEFTRELRRETRAGQASNLKARAQELIVSQGMESETAMRQAIKEVLSGELPSDITDYLSDVTAQVRTAFFDKVYRTLKDEPFEMASTVTALTNALLGKPIPRDPGIKGGSAYTRLQRVFGTQPQVMKALENITTKQKPLEDIVEGVYRNVVEGGAPPIPVDQETAEYLRNLSNIPFGQAGLGEPPFILPSLPPDIRTPAQKATDLQQFKLELTPNQYEGWSPERLESLSYLRINLLNEEYQAKLIEEKWIPPEPLANDKRTPAQRALDLQQFATELAPPATGITGVRYEAPIENALKQMEMIPAKQKNIIIRALKETGMTAIDIGNFLRANKASFDFSWWRQQAPLILNHKSDFLQANIEAWKGMWNQKSAEASWQRIIRDPLYQYYDESGFDFLRPLELPKGTAQWKGVEEFGYLGADRPIPKFTEKLPWVKLSQRAFVTGTNAHNWRVFRDYHNAMLKVSEKIVSGKIKIPTGEVFDMQKEMTDIARLLSDFTGRAKLGKASGLAPVLSSFFFAPRYKLGRILTPRHLFSGNPRIRSEAWKDLTTFVGATGGIILLGKQLGLWDVELDNRSADFMKIRLGNLRVDPWGGYLQLAVLVSRLYEKTGISSITGQEYDVDLFGALTNFIRSSAAPLASLIADLYTGKTFIGEKLDIKDPKQWADRIAPLSLVDIWESFRDSGLSPEISIPVSTLGFLGAGVQSYSGDWGENFTKLGLPKYDDNLALGLNEPVYDTQDFWADHSAEFSGVDLASLTASKGFPGYIRDMVKAKDTLKSLNELPNQKLSSLNADPNKGTTYNQYYQMWRDREKIVTTGDKEKLKEYDKDERTRNAQIGNMTHRQFVLLQQYNQISLTDKKGREDFLKNNPEININPREDYLKTHPEENARLAVWGQAKIYSAEAYNKAIALAKELDIPDNALPDFDLPEDEETRKAYFEYQKTVEKFTSDSPEAHLMLKQNESLRKFLSRSEITTPTPALELDIKNRKLNDQYEALTSEKERDQFKADNPKWAEDQTRISVYKKQYAYDNTEADKKTVEAFVKYDAEPAGDARTLYRIDNPDFDQWGQKVYGWQPLTVKSVDALRLSVKNKEQDKAYNSLPSAEAKTTYLLAPVNKEYALDRFREQGYNAGIAKEQIEAYAAKELKDAEYNTLDAAGKAAYLKQDPAYAVERIKESGTNAGVTEKDLPLYIQYEQTPTEGQARERLLQNNPDYYQNIYLGILKKNPIDFSKVATEKFESFYNDYYSKIGSSEERQLARLEFPWFDQEGANLGKWDNVFVKSKTALQLSIMNQAEDEQYSRILEPVKKRQFEAQHPEWATRKVMITGLNKGVPEKYIQSYVESERIGKAGWALERYMIAHQDYYQKVYKGILGERLDFRNVPSEGLEQQYNIYLDLRGKEKTAYRKGHPALDAWLKRRSLLPPDRHSEEITLTTDEESTPQTGGSLTRGRLQNLLTR